MTRSTLRALVATALAAAAVVSLNPSATEPVAEAAPSPGFVATFDQPSDFYDRFDYGFSGFDPSTNTNPDRLVSWTGDHDTSCGGPTTSRTINIDRGTGMNPLGYRYTDFDPMFWWCRGHMMTSVNAVGYNIAWFSPRPYFTDIVRVCWDINVTQMSSRKWHQVLFVSETDATAHPTSRGSGGYDLGYTNPMFRGAPGTPSAEVLPVAGDLAGLQILNRGHFGWFENQNNWTMQSTGQPINGVSDKAGRYTHCVEQLRPGTIRFTQERPASHGGFQQVDVPGTIPRGPVKVVFQDDNYNGPKGEQYDPNANTWHWDNIVVQTGERSDLPTGPSSRMLDTRPGSVTADGQYQGTGKVTPGRPLEVDIAGRNGIPGSATAAYLNVTATQPDAAGHLTVYPCGSVPNASNVNFDQAGQTVANLALTDLSSGGSVCIAAVTPTHVVIDATGYPSGSSPNAVSPVRMLDTRSGSVTADGRFRGTGKVTPGRPLEVDIAGRNGIPGSATSAFLNVTATQPDAAGYLTIYPCGSVPYASTVNYDRAGQTVANLALTDLSSRGSVCIDALVPTHVVIDASGYSSSTPSAVSPVRMLDTRSGSGSVTADGRFQGTGKVTPGRPLEVTIAGRNGIPGSATSAFLNVTATQPEAAGYLTIYPCGAVPFSSTVNFNHAGQTVANMARTELSPQGTICIYALNPTHVVIDATGYR